MNYILILPVKKLRQKDLSKLEISKRKKWVFPMENDALFRAHPSTPSDYSLSLPLSYGSLQTCRLQRMDGSAKDSVQLSSVVENSILLPFSNSFLYS